MFKLDAEEAAPIVNTTMDAILEWTPTAGRPGSDVRRYCGYVKANSLSYLYTDTLGPPLLKCFDAARLAGISLAQMDNVRLTASQQTVTYVGSLVVRDSLIELALSEMGQIILAMQFTSREDVDVIRTLLNASFADIEEQVADEMDSISFRTVIGLHAAITAYLVETARPLPRMLQFRFAHSWPSLVIAHKLYADAGRADELRGENKVIHPAFELPSGRALSF